MVTSRMNIAQKLAHFVLPSPRSKSPDEEHNKSSNHGSHRCEFTFSDGRQCKMQRAQFCAHHTSKRTPDEGALPVSDEALVGLCSDLTTATNINRAIAQTYLLLAQGRISQKQAIAFGYLSQLLLQTVAGIRAEHVSAFGYGSWESRLKASLLDSDERPDPSGRGENDGKEQPPSALGTEQPGNEVVERQKDVVITSLLPHKEVSPPVKSEISNCKSPAASSPDFGDLLRRGRALLDRKYDMTPEGRREAKSLALELELMNPAPSKPRRDRFGQVVDLVRRIRNHKQGKLEAAIDPSYLEAIRSAPQAPSCAVAAADPKSAHPQPHSPGSNVAPCFSTASSARPNPESPPAAQGVSPNVCPPATPSSAVSAETPAAAEADFRKSESTPSVSPSVAIPPEPPPRRFGVLPSRQEPACCACPESRREPRTVRPAPPAPEKPSPWHSSPDLKSEPSKAVGHIADWYAPASWSHPGSNPFPGRREKLKRELCSMSHPRSRYLQHQNQSRSFWR